MGSKFAGRRRQPYPSLLEIRLLTGSQRCMIPKHDRRMRSRPLHFTNTMQGEFKDTLVQGDSGFFLRRSSRDARVALQSRPGLL